MTVNELYAALDALYPTSLSAPWDNDGRMVVPDGDRKIGKVLCCLDIDAGAIKCALLSGVDVIVSHHPLIFKPLKALDPTGDPVAAKALMLYQNGIAALSFHTRYDCAENGVNDMLSGALELSDVQPLFVDGLQMGRLGTLIEELRGADLAEMVKERLVGAPLRFVCPEKRVRSVAVLGGSGGSYFKEALAAGADAFITGEASHHQLLDAAEAGLCLIAAGHDYTERAVARGFCADIQNIDPSIELVCYDRITIGQL